MRHHIVRRGESLSAIARRYGMRWKKLARINGLHDPNRLIVGQRLTVTAAPTPTMPAVEPARNGLPQLPSSPQPADWMPDAGAEIGRYIGPLSTAMRVHGMDTNERRAAFLAQIGVESGLLRSVVENLNYSAGRLRVVWPRRFRTNEAAVAYENNPEAR